MKQPPPWKRPRPAKKTKRGKLSPELIEAARARALAAGRRYPNLVDNLWAAKQRPRLGRPSSALDNTDAGKIA